MKRTGALLLAALVAGCGAGTSLSPPIERVAPSPGPATVPTADVPTSLPGSTVTVPATLPPGLSLVVVGDSIPRVLIAGGVHSCGDGPTETVLDTALMVDPWSPASRSWKRASFLRLGTRMALLADERDLPMIAAHMEDD